MANLLKPNRHREATRKELKLLFYKYLGIGTEALALVRALRQKYILIAKEVD